MFVIKMSSNIILHLTDLDFHLLLTIHSSLKTLLSTFYFIRISILQSTLSLFTKMLLRSYNS